MKNEPIPQWVFDYNNACYTSSAGKAVKILVDRCSDYEFEIAALRVQLKEQEILIKDGNRHLTNSQNEVTELKEQLAVRAIKDYDEGYAHGTTDMTNTVNLLQTERGISEKLQDQLKQNEEENRELLKQAFKAGYKCRDDETEHGSPFTNIKSFKDWYTKEYKKNLNSERVEL